MQRGTTMTFKMTARTLIAATLMATTAPYAAAAQTAQAAPAGAKAGDKEMNCAQVTAERAEINQAVVDGAAKKQKSAKLKKGLFGFAKTFASMAIPGATMGLGGGSMLGSLAVQSVSSTASQAVSSATIGSGAPAEAKATAKQQARLDRLDKIGAYRQCGA
jgi:hypothetical protein